MNINDKTIRPMKYNVGIEMSMTSEVDDNIRSMLANNDTAKNVVDAVNVVFLKNGRIFLGLERLCSMSDDSVFLVISESDDMDGDEGLFGCTFL